MENTDGNTTNYLLAADNHNIGNVQSSWYDIDSWGTKFGNAGKLAVTGILSGANSFYNTGVTVGNWFGADLQENNTNNWIAGIDSDLGAYYNANQDSADLVGFIAGSLIPGLGGVKILNAGQRVLQGVERTGLLGGNIGRALGLLTPKTDQYIKLAVGDLNQATQASKLLNVQTAKALGAGVWQNTLESAAFETMVQASMFKSPVLENQTMGDIAWNVALGGAVGGVITGAFSGAKIWGGFKSAVRAEDKARMPFQERAQFSEATSPSEKIIQISHDIESSAVPISLTAPDGTVVNNFSATKTLYQEKINKSLLDIRDNINKLSGKDFELGNVVANGMHPGKLTDDMVNFQGFSQQTLDNFNGAVRITRATSITSEEKAWMSAAKKAEQGIAPEVDQVTARYVGVLGEDMGKVFDRKPEFLSLADTTTGGRKGILNSVKSYGFSMATQWDPSQLKGAGGVSEAEARHIWASKVLPDGKISGATIHINDIPLLERAYTEGKLDFTIHSGSGPGLEVIHPASREELWQIIKESKLEVARGVISNKSFKRSTEAAARVTNTKRSYLEGTVSQNEFSDLMAHQSYTGWYLQNLREKGLPTSTTEGAIDPMFLPKVAKVVYSLEKDKLASDGNIINAITFFKQKQQLYQDQAKNVAAKILGSKYSDNLPDLTDKALITANRNGSGAGLFSFENSNYGTLGSSMAWIGNITREAKASFRKEVSQLLEAPLIKLGQNPEAAIEFEGINQKVSRSGKQWVLDDSQGGLVSVEKAGVESESILISQEETLSAVRAHIEASGRRTDSYREIRAVQGLEDHKNPLVFRPIRPNLKDYPHFAFVNDPQVTGTGHMSMIHAATEKELAELIQKVPSNYSVITKTDTEDWFKARHEYERGRTLHENYLDSDLKNRGVFSNFFPKSSPDKIVNDVLQQHYRDSDILVQETIRLRYEPQLSMLEDLGKSFSKTETSKFASSRELIEKTADNPYFNYIKTALDISKASEHHLLYGFNKGLDEAFSKFTGNLNEIWQGTRSTADLDRINAALDLYGVKPAYYDASLHLLANHTAPKGELTKFIRGANSLLSLFTLGLDPLNAVNNAVGSNILRFTELRHLTKAIEQGNVDVAGALSGLSKIKTPGTGDEIFAPSKLVQTAISNFWKDEGSLISQYKADGIIKDRVEQLKLLVDDFTLKGTETVKELDGKLSVGFQRAKDLSKLGEKLSGNPLAEEFNRFISADVMRQITDVGIANNLLSPAEAKAYINTFVNRVEGNTIASQRPLIFQGPVGQAIGLFQSYQFNLLQQLFRYTSEGSKKDLGMLFGLQSTLYGAQSLPAFQFINTHIVGQLSGNKEHRDAYDSIYGAVGRTAGDWMLYGAPSNILQGNLYSRGDINPRQITVLPTTMQEIPVVAGFGKFFSSMKEMVGKIGGGGNVWESLLQGLEHNGVSRPLAGMAQVLQAAGGGQVYSTSSKGSILYSNDLMAYASLVRVAGGRPLDEAIVNDAMFRVKSYEASQRLQMEGLRETVRSTLIEGNQPADKELAQFATRYAELGGRQAGFNKWMMGLYKTTNVSQSHQLETNLKNPFNYKIQLLMGGEDE